MGTTKIQIELSEEALAQAIWSKAALMRLKINEKDAGILAREVMNVLTPNQETYKSGEEIEWMHGYDYEKWPPCKGKVVRFPKGATKVEIEYLSTLWESAGETKRSLVYPASLRKIKKTAETEGAEAAVETAPADTPVAEKAGSGEVEVPPDPVVDSDPDTEEAAA